MTMPRSEHERREVRSADPSLSPETNRRVTEELRDIVGRDAVDVPADRPDHRFDRHERHGPTPGNAAVPIFAALVILVVGFVIWLATGSWWVMVLAVAIDLVAVLLLASGTIRLTTDVEHPSPGLAARLEEEGVADPDAMMTSLVEELSEKRER